MFQKIFYIIFLLVCSFTLKPAYQFYDKEGKKTSYENLLLEAEKADIICFGELHNNAMVHWLQLQLAKDLALNNKTKLVFGAEMFEADDQIVLSEYQNGFIKESHFRKEAKMWDNYTTDYKPLLDLANVSKIPFIATNIPRRYASLVARQGLKGLEKLDTEAKKWIAPLPVTVDLNLPGYAEMIKMASHGQMNGNSGKPEYFAEAQAIKDATMAHFILKNWQKGKIFLHFNGSYHSENAEGIVWYLKKQNPSLKILTIGSVEQDNIQELEKIHLGKANFLLALPSDMAKSY